MLKWLDGQEFYELMQCYRHTPLSENVTGAFESVKSYLKLMFLKEALDFKSLEAIKKSIISEKSGN